MRDRYEAFDFTASRFIHLMIRKACCDHAYSGWWGATKACSLWRGHAVCPARESEFANLELRLTIVHFFFPPGAPVATTRLA
jgi:hypothetical protein